MGRQYSPPAHRGAASLGRVSWVGAQSDEHLALVLPLCTSLYYMPLLAHGKEHPSVYGPPLLPKMSALAEFSARFEIRFRALDASREDLTFPATTRTEWNSEVGPDQLRDEIRSACEGRSTLSDRIRASQYRYSVLELSKFGR